MTLDPAFTAEIFALTLALFPLILELKAYEGRKKNCQCGESPHTLATEIMVYIPVYKWFVFTGEKKER